MDIANFTIPLPLVIDSNEPLLSALQSLREAGLDCAPVVDEEQRLVGELRVRVALESLTRLTKQDGPQLTGNAMSWDIPIVCSSGSLRAARDRMRARHMRKLYVVDPDLRLRGEVTLERLERATASCSGCEKRDPSTHEVCRGRWCSHARICADSDAPHEQPQRA
jgi:CBS domain-containing protein